jgi:hypothetical protein
MSSLPGMPSSITCAACGFENATTSLYCQDCGVRLVAPPSFAVEESAAAANAASSPVTNATRKKPPRILSTNRENHVGKIIVITLRTLIVAALAALIIVLARTPDDLPAEESPLSPETIANIRLGLMRNAQKGKPLEAPWSGQGINAYLAGALAHSRPDVTARVAPDGDDGLKLFVRHKLGSIHYYTTTSYRIVVRGNGINLVRTGGAIGRLTLPPWAWASLDSANGAVVEVLTPDFNILHNATGARINENGVHVDFGAAVQ